MEGQGPHALVWVGDRNCHEPSKAGLTILHRARCRDEPTHARCCRAAGPYVLIEGWLLVSCSSSSSSMQVPMSKGRLGARTPGSRAWSRYMWRLRGPSREEEEEGV